MARRSPDAQDAVVIALQLIVQWDAARKSRVLPQSLRNRAIHALGVWGDARLEARAASQERPQPDPLHRWRRFTCSCGHLRPEERPSIDVDTLSNAMRIVGMQQHRGFGRYAELVAAEYLRLSGPVGEP
jgi:hypothetical protein